MLTPEEKLSMAIGVMTAWASDHDGSDREFVADVADLVIEDGTLKRLTDGPISLNGG